LPEQNLWTRAKNADSKKNQEEPEVRLLRHVPERGYLTNTGSLRKMLFLIYNKSFSPRYAKGDLMKLKLSAPKEITWIIAVVAGVLGLLMNYGVISLGGISAFLLVAFGFVLLAVATYFKGL
jgi:hypothetical protein